MGGRLRIALSAAAFSNFYLNIKIKDIMKKYVEKSLESLKIQNLTIEEQEKLKGGSVNSTNYTITLMQP